MTQDVSGKRLELFKEAVPNNLSRVAVLTDVTDAFRDRLVKAYQASGERLGLSMWPVEVKTPEDIEPAFAKIAQDSANNGIIVGAGGLTFVQRGRIWSSSYSATDKRLRLIAVVLKPSSCWPSWSRTMKQAPLYSSTAHGGGKRRLPVNTL
jgi:hypothetical protein